MSALFTFDSLAAFAALTLLEIVLGVDNLVFIAILSGKLPKSWQSMARKIGLALAALGRIVLLFGVAWLVTLQGTDLFTVLGRDISIKDAILILGGVFLIGKATWEIHANLEGSAHGQNATPTNQDPEADNTPGSVRACLALTLAQIVGFDLVFSIDSVLTAVGIVKPDDYPDVANFPFTTIPWVPLTIMVAAILVSIGVMLLFIDPISRFVQRHPTIKMLALAFLTLIGVVLVAEGFHEHIPRGYIYFAMGFSLGVELLNLKFSKKAKPPKPAPGDRHEA